MQLWCIINFRFIHLNFLSHLWVKLWFPCGSWLVVGSLLIYDALRRTKQCRYSCAHSGFHMSPASLPRKTCCFKWPLTVRLLTHILCRPTLFFFQSFIATMSNSLQKRSNNLSINITYPYKVLFKVKVARFSLFKRTHIHVLLQKMCRKCLSYHILFEGVHFALSYYPQRWNAYVAGNLLKIPNGKNECQITNLFSLTHLSDLSYKWSLKKALMQCSRENEVAGPSTD